MAKRVWEAGIFVLFAVVGALSHGREVTLERVLVTAAPLWLAWVLVSRWKDPYRGRMTDLLLVALVAVPLGVAGRALLLGEPLTTALLPFALIALVFTLLLMALGRRLA